MHVIYLKSPFPKLPSNSICANFYLYSTAIIFKPFEFNMHPSHLLSLTVCVNCNVVIMQRIIALLCYVHKTGRRRIVLTVEVVIVLWHRDQHNQNRQPYQYTKNNIPFYLPTVVGLLEKQCMYASLALKEANGVFWWWGECQELFGISHTKEKQSNLLVNVVRYQQLFCVQSYSGHKLAVI